jgi:hypothetical protein
MTDRRPPSLTRWADAVDPDTVRGTRPATAQKPWPHGCGIHVVEGPEARGRKRGDGSEGTGSEGTGSEGAGYGAGVGRAVIIGGTGAIGRATARLLLAAGWSVELTGRDPARMPRDIAAPGGRFTAADRSGTGRLRAVFGNGADLLVDCACYTARDAASLLPLARDAASLLPLARDAASTVMISSKAVYVDADGRHSNSPVRPDFGGPGRRTSHGRPRVRRPPDRGGLPREQGRGRAGAAGQRRPGHRAAPLQDPRGRDHGSRVSGCSSSASSTGARCCSWPTRARAWTSRRARPTSPRSSSGPRAGRDGGS